MNRFKSNWGNPKTLLSRVSFVALALSSQAFAQAKPVENTAAKPGQPGQSAPANREVKGILSSESSAPPAGTSKEVNQSNGALPAAAKKTTGSDSTDQPDSPAQGSPATTNAAAKKGSVGATRGKSTTGTANEPSASQSKSEAGKPVDSSSVPAAPAAARPGKTKFPFSLYVDITPTWIASRGYDLYSGDNVATRAGVGGEVDVMEPVKQLFLSLDLSATGFSKSDQVAGSLDTSLNALYLLGGVRLRRSWNRYLATHVSANAGATQVKTSFNSGPTTKDWGAYAQLGVGASIEHPIPVKAIVCPGLLVEGGYGLGGSTKLQLRESAPQDAMPRQSASLGELNLSGPYLRFALYLRF